jgi:hypothetical protein
MRAAKRSRSRTNAAGEPVRPSISKMVGNYPIREWQGPRRGRAW